MGLTSSAAEGSLPTVAGSRSEHAARPALEGEKGEARLVVALHGRGGDALRFQRTLAPLVDGQVLSLEGPRRTRAGAAWLSQRASTSYSELARELGVATHLVAAAIRDELQAARYPERMALVGFSQGGTVAAALALGHPELVSEVVVVNAHIPLDLIPSAAPPSAPRFRIVYAEADRTVPPRHALRAADKLRAAGFEVRVDPIAGAEHTLGHDAWAGIMANSGL